MTSTSGLPWPRNDTRIIEWHGNGSAIFRTKRLAFCRLTQLGFLRLLTNKHVMQDEFMRPDEAWEAYSVLRLDRRIGYLPEPSELSETWQAFTEGQSSSPNLWTDAYLCALAQAARLNLVTFDAKIPAREGVNCLVLRP